MIMVLSISGLLWRLW